MAWSQLSIAIVGANYSNADGGNRRSEIAFCDPGESLSLRPEPKNEHDEHAIAVLSARGFQIGYVSSERAVLIGGLMRDGHTVTTIFQDVAAWGAIARVGIDCDPALPQARASGAAETNLDDCGDRPLIDDVFWPDYLPPDE